MDFTESPQKWPPPPRSDFSHKCNHSLQNMVMHTICPPCVAMLWQGNWSWEVSWATAWTGEPTSTPASFSWPTSSSNQTGIVELSGCYPLITDCGIVGAHYLWVGCIHGLVPKVQLDIYQTHHTAAFPRAVVRTNVANKIQKTRSPWQYLLQAIHEDRHSLAEHPQDRSYGHWQVCKNTFILP